jgi:hypothetical protein
MALPHRRSLRDLIRAFAARTIEQHVLLRALVEHDDWYLPLSAFVHYGLATAALVLPPDGKFSSPADKLWLFTDREATQVAIAAGAKLGVGGGIAGSEIFAKVDPSFGCVSVNPGSNASLSFQLPASMFGLLAQWAAAVRVERGLDQSDGTWLEQLLSYDGLTTVTANGALVSWRDIPGLGCAANLFTAIDGAYAYLDKLPPELRAQATTSSVDGEAFFRELAHLGIDGVVINGFGPARPHVIGAEDCRRLADLATA